MDATHLHLVLNHFPILGTLFGLVLLAYGLFRSNRSISNAGLVTFIVIALIAIPAFLSGEKSEDSVEQLPGVSEVSIEGHEEIAEIAIWLMEGLGLLALVTILVTLANKWNTRRLMMVTLVASVVVFGVMARVANLGGKIRHSEIRSENESTPSHVEDDDDDDDDD